ncbi:hypothetical protein [Desulfoferula mesophila]
MSDSGDQQAIAKDVAGSLDRLEYWCEELSYRLSGALAEAGEKNRKERANLGRRDFFQNVFHKAPVGYLVIDSQSRVAETNTAAEGILRQSGISRNDRDQLLAVVRKHFQVGVKTQLPVSQMVLINSGDAQQGWLQVTSKIMPDENGEPVLLSALTELKDFGHLLGKRPRCLMPFRFISSRKASAMPLSWLVSKA